MIFKLLYRYIKPALPEKDRSIGFFILLFILGWTACDPGGENQKRSSNSPPGNETPRASSKTGGESKKSNVALSVGDVTYTERDLRLKEKVIKLKYSGTESAKLGAVARLTKAALLRILLKNVGHPVTNRQVKKEIRRINQNTKAPELLSRIKSLLGGEQSRNYRRLFVEPVFVNRRFMFEVYPRLKTVHGKRKQTMKSILKTIRESGDPLKTHAKKNVTYRKSRFNPEKGLRRYHRKEGTAKNRRRGKRTPFPGRDGNGSGANKYKQILSGLEPGEVYEKVINSRQHFSILKYLGTERRNGKEGKIVARLILPKKPPHEYLWEEASNIPIWIKSKTLRNRFRNNVSWSRHLRLVTSPEEE